MASSLPKPVFTEDSTTKITRTPFPGSRKVYVEGSDPSIQVAMREVTQTPTRSGKAGEVAAYQPGVRERCSTKGFRLSRQRVKSPRSGLSAEPAHPEHGLIRHGSRSIGRARHG